MQYIVESLDTLGKEVEGFFLANREYDKHRCTNVVTTQT
jgi:hypothetical protein